MQAHNRQPEKTRVNQSPSHSIIDRRRGFCTEQAMALWRSSSSSLPDSPSLVGSQRLPRSQVTGAVLSPRHREEKAADGHVDVAFGVTTDAAWFTAFSWIVSRGQRYTMNAQSLPTREWL